MCSWFVIAVVLTGHDLEELIRALCNLFSLFLRLLALSSAIQQWTRCRKKQQLGKQMNGSTWLPQHCVHSLSMLCSVIRLLTIMTKTNTVMFLIHLSQGIEKPGWEYHEVLEVWCCFLFIPLIFSSVSSSAGIEPSACYDWERMGWITFSRAQVILRCNKTSMETKWGFNWANCWCLRPLSSWLIADTGTAWLF